MEEKPTLGQKITTLFNTNNSKEHKEENETKIIRDMITSLNYPFEEHLVETSDGYILKLFRISDGNKEETEPARTPKPPVLFQHGGLDSADGWLCNAESRCLPYIMANAGFDVWISNSRGNKYCKKHKVYDNKSFEFWQFSLHEMGGYDIPAVLEYIKTNNNSNEKIIYFGHSQGTSMLFNGLSTKSSCIKEYIKLFVALAPVARLTHMTSDFLKGVQKIGLHKLLKKVNIYEMFPESEKAENFSTFLSKHFSTLTNFSGSGISDNNSKMVNDEAQLAVYLKHFPCGTSIKTLNHFAQIYSNKRFTGYDYKPEANMKIYNSVTPPEYELGKIKDIPIMLIAGDEDRGADPTDVKWLHEQVKENVVYYNICPTLGHVSFLIGKSIEWFDEPFEIIMNQYKK